MTLTFDGSRVKSYINSSFVGDLVQTKTPAYLAGITAKIGMFDNNTYYFQGFIDDVRIYNRAPCLPAGRFPPPRFKRYIPQQTDKSTL